MKANTTLNRQIYAELFPPNLSKSDQRRMDILIAAIGTFADVDHDRISLDDVAQRAKTSARLVRHYFPEKNELFEMTMKLIRGRYQLMVIEAMEKAEEPRAKLEAYIRSAVDWPRSLPVHVRAWFFFYVVCAKEKKYRQMHEELAEIGEERISALLKDAFSKRRFKDEDLHFVAKSVQRLITGGLIEICSEAMEPDISAVQDQVLRASWAMINSLEK